MCINMCVYIYIYMFIYIYIYIYIHHKTAQRPSGTRPGKPAALRPIRTLQFVPRVLYLIDLLSTLCGPVASSTGAHGFVK